MQNPCEAPQQGFSIPDQNTVVKNRPMKKDRHSKITTAKGPRDRRMRLSIDVARKFFDLQDVLGYDNASKTVEWLLNQDIGEHLSTDSKMGSNNKKNRLSNGEAGSNHRKHRKETTCQEDSAGDTHPDVLRESRKRQNGMTLEEMYNKEYDFDEDEDDSDWEPSEIKTEALKWFCVNCTMLNIDDITHCDVCGEHRESGILNHGFFASPLLPGRNIDLNGSEGNELPPESCSENPALIKSTLVGYDERMLLHAEVEMKSQIHPERPDRLRAIAASLATAGIFPGKCYPILAREITRAELLKIHAEENVGSVEMTSHMLASYFTPDTYANGHSALAARLAAGVCADLASTIFSGRARNGFALVRPPGHHAGVKQAMGFCLHNNAAIAASAAQVAGAKRVLILDWDVHHGNGTQEIFNQSKSVLYVSLHRHQDGKFYPGTGAADEVGTMGAEGYCVNIPWSCGGVGDKDYLYAFQHVVIPIASAFAPDFTIISAGFDAARGDPLGCCDVTPTGFAQMTQMLSTLSAGKLLVILEGGYNLRSISASAIAVIKVLLGEAASCNLDEVVPSKPGLRTVFDVLKIQMKYWPALESIYFKLQTEWEFLASQDPSDNIRGSRNAGKPAKRRRKMLVPLWWKLGPKRWLFYSTCQSSFRFEEKVPNADVTVSAVFREV